MKEIKLMIGNIGSGKSTYIKKQKGYYVISRDDLRYSVGGGNYIFDDELEPIIKDVSVYFTCHLMQINKNIIVDEVNICKKLREETIVNAKYFDYKVIAVKTHKLSMAESVERRFNNNHGNTPKEVWFEVWKKFDNMYEEPTVEEGFDEIIQLDKNGEVLTRLWK